MEDKRIKKGAFIIARKLFESELWLYKPLSWKIIWIYILGRVSHKETKTFKRGEGYFNFSQEIRAIGLGITYNHIREFLRYARSSTLVNTRRTTRGIILKVLKYNEYQTLDNYTNTRQNKIKTQQKHNGNTPIYKNVKNGKYEKNKDSVRPSTFNVFYEAYPKKERRKEAQAIWTRKSLDKHLKVILAFIIKAKKSDRWKRGYIKQPPTFLNGECWNDDLESYEDTRQGSVHVL